MSIAAEQLYKAIQGYIDEVSIETERRLLNKLAEQGITEPDRSLDIQQAAIRLGVSDKTLYEMCKKKMIPHRRFGSRILFSSNALDKWGREQDRLNSQGS